MRGATECWTIVVACATLAYPGVGAAQRPVCPQPSAQETYYGACVPDGRMIAACLLFDLSIDHLFKADTLPFKRRPGDLMRSIVQEDTLAKNDALRTYLDRLDSVNLTKVDTATGLLDLSVPEDERRLRTRVEIANESYQLSLRLPARVAGGYWRTPGVFQVAFWAGQRPALAVRSPGGIAFAAEIECLVASFDGLRVVTAGRATPDILVGFDQCQ